jgi:hypothetical protein
MQNMDSGIQEVMVSIFSDNLLNPPKPTVSTDKAP